MFRLSAALCAIILAVPAVSQATERLVAEPYPGNPPWQEVVTTTPDGGFLRKQAPADRTHDLLVIQSIPGVEKTTAADAVESFTRAAVTSCEGFNTVGPKPSNATGYDEAYVQISCARRRGRPEGLRIYAKAILGEEAVYLVWRELPWPVSKLDGRSKDPAVLKAEAVATNYLASSVYLCGARSTDPRCAAAKP